MPRSLAPKLLLLLLLSAFAAAPLCYGWGIPMPHHNEHEQILAMENQWRQAQIAGDLSAMEKLLSDNFIGVTMSGQVVTKLQQLDRMRSRDLVITRFQMSDTKVKVIAHGQVAIVNSLAEVQGTAEGHPINGSFRYTRVYQKLSSGAWKITSFEATHVPGSGGQPSVASGNAP